MSKRTTFFLRLLLLCFLSITSIASAEEDVDVRFFGRREILPEFFNVTTHANSENTLAVLKNLGFDSTRVDFRWLALEPTQGDYQFNNKNWIIKSTDLSLKHNLKLLPVISWAPKWAELENRTWPNEKSVKAFEEFMFKLASKYKGKIHYWQALNEPNMAVWKEQYIVFLKAFTQGVRRADPTNKIVLCGFAGKEGWQLEQVYKLGGKPYFDIIAAHPYTRPNLPEEGGFLQKLEELRNVMLRYEDPKPLWITEIGFNGVAPAMLEYLRAKYPYHRHWSITEQKQAEGLARTFLIGATIPWLERLYFFNLFQRAHYTEVDKSPDAYIGVACPWIDKPRMYRPKKAFFAVRNVKKQIQNSTFEKKLRMGDRIWALAFTRKEDALISIWTLDEQVILHLEDSSAIQSVTSMIGVPIKIEKNQLVLTGSPMYLQIPKEKLADFSNQLIKAKVSGARKLNIQLRLDTKRTTPSDPVIRATLRNQSKGAFRTPPVSVGCSKGWRVAKNPMKGGQLLAAGQSFSYPVVLKTVHSNNNVAFTVKASADFQGREVSNTANIQYIQIPKFQAVVDGKLEEWNGHTPIALNKKENRKYPQWKGPRDLSANVWTSWNEESFCLAVEVQDDRHHQSSTKETAHTLWKEDSIQVGLDLGNNAQPTGNFSNYDGVNDVEIGFGLGPKGPIAYCWENGGHSPALLKLKNLSIVRAVAKGITRYEVEIPWSSMPSFQPKSGRWIGINVIVNDSDGNSREGWLQWSPGMVQRKDPSEFTKAVLK